MPLKKCIENGRIEVGCDEAGRGCLAGPVVAAAVILPADFDDFSIDDSKKLSALKREKLVPEIKSKAIAYAIGVVNNKEIDEINILNASFLAMHRALDQIQIKYDLIAVDGNRFQPYKHIPFSCQIKGDGKFLHIAAASILAKTHRDALMQKLHLTHPEYDWKTNKGYPTNRHRKAIIEFGATPLHRNSFKLISE